MRVVGKEGALKGGGGWGEKDNTVYLCFSASLIASCRQRKMDLPGYRLAPYHSSVQ